MTQRSNTAEMQESAEGGRLLFAMGRPDEGLTIVLWEYVYRYCLKIENEVPASVKNKIP